MFSDSELEEVFSAMFPGPSEVSAAGPYPTALDRFQCHFEMGCWSPREGVKARVGDDGPYSPTDMPSGPPWCDEVITIDDSGDDVSTTSIGCGSTHVVSSSRGSSPAWYCPTSPVYIGVPESLVDSGNSSMSPSIDVVDGKSCSPAKSDDLFPFGCVPTNDVASMEDLYRGALERSVARNFSYRLPTVVRVTIGLDGFPQIVASCIDPCLGPGSSRMLELRQYVDELCRNLGIELKWCNDF